MFPSFLRRNASFQFSSCLTSFSKVQWTSVRSERLPSPGAHSVRSGLHPPPPSPGPTFLLPPPRQLLPRLVHRKCRQALTQWLAFFCLYFSTEGVTIDLLLFLPHLPPLHPLGGGFWRDPERGERCNRWKAGASSLDSSWRPRPHLQHRREAISKRGKGPADC